MTYFPAVNVHLLIGLQENWPLLPSQITLCNQWLCSKCNSEISLEIEGSFNKLFLARCPSRNLLLPQHGSKLFFFFFPASENQHKFYYRPKFIEQSHAINIFSSIKSISKSFLGILCSCSSFYLLNIEIDSPVIWPTYLVK